VIEDLERDLDALRALADKTNDADARSAIERIVTRLQPGQTVTTTEAARLLGIRSINTVKALVLSEEIPHTRAGNRMMIPVSEILRLKESQWVSYLKHSDRVHEEIGGEPMTHDEMDILSETRPGTLPWQRPK